MTGSWVGGAAGVDARGQPAPPARGPALDDPGDVTLDARRGPVGIVSLEANRFELWTWAR
jgi:hypothetical protein